MKREMIQMQLLVLTQCHQDKLLSSSDDGKELIVKGNGEVTLKFKWDDDPR